MNPDSWHRVKDIFADALALPEADRLQFAEDQSAGDEEILHQVQRLLRHSPVKSRIDQPILGSWILRQ